MAAIDDTPDRRIRVGNRLRQRHPGIGVVVLTQCAEPRYGLEPACAQP